MRVLICGGGVIGASIAYFLAPARSRRRSSSSGPGVACAASGKSGGFLALDWCDGSPLEALARRSFALHASLAERDRRRLGLSAPRHLWRICQRRADGRAPRRRHRARLALGRAWPSAAASARRETTAQVHPGLFTAAMMRAAQAHGAELRLGPRDRPRARRRQRGQRRRGRRRADRGRRRRHRHGAVVDAGCGAGCRCRRSSA